jgi:hypothetical protein
MTFSEIKGEVTSFLNDSRSGDPSGRLNAYFSGINAYFSGISEEARIGEAEELLNLIAEQTARPQSNAEMINSGSPGVIAMGIPYAYPLLLTVLGWWVFAVLKTGTKTELTAEEEATLHKRLKDGITRWDWLRCDDHHYDPLLNQLVPPQLQPQQQQSRIPGILARIKQFFRGS